MLDNLDKETIVIETKENNTRKLLITKSITGGNYGKYGRIYFFTEKEHYAHPSVMIIQLKEVDGKLTVHRSGFSKGMNENFDKWVDSASSEDEKHMNEIFAIKELATSNLKSKKTNTIGYENVKDALESLKNKSGTNVSLQVAGPL